MKIAVVGLYSIKNVGDNVLCYSTIHLLRQMLPRVRIVEVDANPTMAEVKQYGRIRAFIARVMIHFQKDLFSYECHTKFRYWYEKTMWKLKSQRYFKDKLKGCDAVVFAGGGFLKFRTQGLNYYVEQIISIARDQHALVMMNGVGIEGYDENDIRCQKLKGMINDSCVKVITTRDDIDILNNNYMTNKDILTSRVGDPALWTPEVYDIHRAETIRDVVAVNLIRGNVYQDYGNKLSPLGLENLYRHLLRKLDERGIRWVLFSNGMKADDAFGKALLETMGYHENDKLVTFSSTEEYMRYLSSVACTFGARLHACIISYAMDVPVTGLIWNDKTRFFSEIIGKRQYFFDENELDVDKIVDAIQQAANDQHDSKTREELKELTRSYVEKFCKILKAEKKSAQED